jgi:ABC-2 type transport system permease protein
MSANLFEATRGGASSASPLRWLVAGEFRKLTSTSAWWALPLPAALLSLTFGLVGAGQARAEDILLFGIGIIAPIFAVLFGVVCVAAEFRHNTIATSYLVAANRARLAVAKLATAALVGAGYAVICAAASIGGLLTRGGLWDAQVLPLLAMSAGSMLVLALWAAAGVGLGWLITRHASLVSVLYLLVVEPIIAIALGVAGMNHAITFLPYQAAVATLESLGGGLGAGGHFGMADRWWLTLLALAGYTVVIVLAGIRAASRRDIS